MYLMGEILRCSLTEKPCNTEGLAILSRISFPIWRTIIALIIGIYSNGQYHSYRVCSGLFR
jgi:hypothetical protein